jgi:hypothetical protein
MKPSRRNKIVQGLACVLLLVALQAWAQKATAEDPVQKEVEGVLKQARAEIRAFEKAGGEGSDPAHPVTKWVEALWAYREKHPGSRAAAVATSEAVHLLVHAKRFAEVRARADQLPVTDATWEMLAGYILESASAEKEHSYFFSKVESVLGQATDKRVRAALHFTLGRGYRDKNEEAKAVAAFRSAIEEDAGSEIGTQAKGILYELSELAPGKPAPAFSVTARDGSAISLAGFRGKAVVLVFWSTS